MRKIINHETSFVALVMWIGFIWLHTFMRVIRFPNRVGTMDFLQTALLTLGLTFFWFWCLLDHRTVFFDDFCGSRHLLNFSLISIALLAILLLLSVSAETWSYNFSFLGDTKIVFLNWSIEKIDLYYIVVFIVFPLMTAFIFHGMSLEHFDSVSIISGSVQIVLLTIMNFLIFMRLPNIWLVEMAVINILTLSGAVYKYAWKAVKKKGNAATFIGLYAVVWGFLLSRFYYSGESAVQYLYQGAYNERLADVRTLTRMAEFAGRSEAFENSSSVQVYMRFNADFIHNILYYGGRLPAFLFVGYLIVFLILLWKMLGRRNQAVHRHQLVFDASFLIIALAIVVGIPYSLGLLPIPIDLPFEGRQEIIYDTVAFGLLLICAKENRKIDRIRLLGLVEVSEVLGNISGGITVFDSIAERAYTEEGTGLICGDADEVIVKSSEQETSCFAQWFGYGNHRYTAFIPKNTNSLFVLEFREEDSAWIETDDQEARLAVLKKYKVMNKPDCMEDTEENTDEGYKNETGE